MLYFSDKAKEYKEVFEIEKSVDDGAVAVTKDNDDQEYRLENKREEFKAICEKDSGKNYNWIEARGGQNILANFKPKGYFEALRYCYTVEGRLIEPVDDLDIIEITDNMKEMGLDYVWLGIRQPEENEYKQNKCNDQLHLCIFSVLFQ